MSEIVHVKVKTDTFLLGEVDVEIKREGQYNKIFSAVVVNREVTGGREDDVPALGHHYRLAIGKTPGEFSRNPNWADVPPNPVCPVCKLGIHIGYSYDGLTCSCWQRVDGEIVVCWKGEPHEMIEDPKGIGNPWIKQISYGGFSS